MWKLLSRIFVGFSFAVTPALVTAESLLEQSIGDCFSGTQEAVEEKLKGLHARLFSVGEQGVGKVVNYITPNMEHLYTFLVTTLKSGEVHICAIGGGREPDIVMSRKLDWLAQSWPGNVNRFHPHQFERRHGFKFPMSRLGEEIDFSSTVFALSYFSTGKTFYSDAYDEEWDIDLNMIGEKVRMSRGELVRGLIEPYVTGASRNGKELGQESLDNYKAVMDGADHQLPIIYLLFNKDSRDWYLVAWNPKTEAPTVFAQGTNIRFADE